MNNYGRIKQAALLGNIEAQQEVMRVEGTGIDFLVKQATLGDVEASNILDGLEIAFGAGFVKQAQLQELGMTKVAFTNEVISGAKDLYNGAINGAQDMYGRVAGFAQHPIDNTVQFAAGVPDASGDAYRHAQNSYDRIAADLKDEYSDYQAGGQNVYLDRIGDGFRHAGNYAGRVYGDMRDIAGDMYSDHPAALAAAAAAAGTAGIGYGAYRATRPKTASFTNAEARAVEMAAGMLANNERQTKVARLASNPKVAEVAAMILRGEIR